MSVQQMINKGAEIKKGTEMNKQNVQEQENHRAANICI